MEVQSAGRKRQLLSARKSRTLIRGEKTEVRMMKPEHASPLWKQQIDNVKPSKQMPAGRNSSYTKIHPDATVRLLKDQLSKADIYLGLVLRGNNSDFIKELRASKRDVQKVLGDAKKDSELPEDVYEKLMEMKQILDKGMQINRNCRTVTRNLRVMYHINKGERHDQDKQTEYLQQLAAETLPMCLHCLPLRLTAEYYSSGFSKRQLPYQERLEDPTLYHYAVISDNVLAAGVVVNSTVLHAENPQDHVFHIITDKLNYAAMRMWFLANPPGKAAIQIQNIDEFTWLNSSYSPVLKQLESESAIDYYFRNRRDNSSKALKFRNPKYLSILNHIRFYLPKMFPKLNKVLFLDDDIVVQKDLTALWSIDLKGMVNGAVETCGKTFHRFDKYLNFSNPLIANNFDPQGCAWAYGMNVFDLAEWRRQNITDDYHYWQMMNKDRLLWDLGTLPVGLLTFWKRTMPIDRSWHLLGLGYQSDVNQENIERAGVIHYNGNAKPWLEIGSPMFRHYWSKFVDSDQVYLRDCNIRSLTS
ncbi:probable galacturonosyltransferase 4 [Typha latifolia]|uniref:probable galacturonosyltransferase 4 n=1 Tax=Typha latifolia TaxID=4733 RepID=UPI003C2E56F7